VEFGRPRLGDVRAKKVIVIHGYSYHPSFYHWVAANDIQLVYAPSHRHALAMLKQYRGDYYMAEELRVRWQARHSGVSLVELHMMDFSNIIPPSVVYLLFDKRILRLLVKELTRVCAKCS
jgi:polar amino acid transport system substrate-binding protein